jgi:hypothetical protein
MSREIYISTPNEIVGTIPVSQDDGIITLPYIENLIQEWGIVSVGSEADSTPSTMIVTGVLTNGFAITETFSFKSNSWVSEEDAKQVCMQNIKTKIHFLLEFLNSFIKDNPNE